MRVHVVGAGAIGGYAAARLHAAGHDVTVVDANAEHVAAINADGLRIEGARSLTAAVRAVAPGEATGPIDLVLLAVKARHTDAALDVIVPRLSADGVLVSLQNGLHEDLILDRAGPGRAVGALVTFGGYYRRPGVIRYAGDGTFVIGDLGTPDPPRLDRLIDLLAAVHPVRGTTNVRGYLWSKTAVAAVYFATAIADQDVPDLLASPDLRPTFEALVREVAGVAAAQGVVCEPVDGFDPSAFLPPPDLDRVETSWRAQLDYWGANGAARTGMWRDLAVHRRPTEVGQILEPVLARAERLGVDVPTLTGLVATVRATERGERELGIEALHDLARPLPQAPSTEPRG